MHIYTISAVVHTVGKCRDFFLILVYILVRFPFISQVLSMFINKYPYRFGRLQRVNESMYNVLKRFSDGLSRNKSYK